MDQIHRTAVAAGHWWAERLDDGHADKRADFAAAITRLCEADLRSSGRCRLDVDYDPFDHVLTAVRETVAPKCSGCLFSAEGILPFKHSLDVQCGMMMPKEGYGNRTEAIEVP